MKIIGIDEVGYGAWAGPLLNSAVYIDIPNFESGDLSEIHKMMTIENYYMNCVLQIQKELKNLLKHYFPK